MIKLALSMQKEKRFIIQGIIIFVVFMTIYTILDYLNGGYVAMYDEYGLFLVIINIVINIIMTFISTMLFNLSSAMMAMTGKEGKSSFSSMIAVFFGMLTYGCTPCVIGFFAVIGITFSVAVLPLAGLPYKLIALGILLLGSVWLLYELNRAKCRPNLIKEKNNES